MQYASRPDRNFCIIANPNAGRGYPSLLLQEVEKELAIHSYTYTIYKGTLPNDLNGFSDLIIIGGDGTINMTLNHFNDIAIPIIILPAGTGNDFSWKLSGKKNCIDILKEAIDKKPVKVDAGLCNGRIFLNGVGIGFDGEVAKKLGANKSLGFLSYLLRVLRTIFTYREPQIQIACNEIKKDNPYLMVSVANGSRYGGGFMVAPGADLCDGLLDLVLIKPLSVLKRLRYLPLMRKGGHVNKSFVKYQTIEKVIITSKKTLPAHLDGELLQSNRFEISILKGKYLLSQ
jgi:diacylglycerol kinase (ATP)